MEDNRLNYRMRALRLALGLSQEEVGAIIGVSNVTVSLYERGLIDSSYCNDIAGALYDVIQVKVGRYGYWYDSYIELQTALNEIQVWIELEGHAPVDVIQRAKDKAAAFEKV